MAEYVVLDVTTIRTNLLEMAGLRGWEALDLDGEEIGGSESYWWAVLATSDEAQLRRLHDAAWEAWVDTTATLAQRRMVHRWFREPVPLSRYRREGRP